MKASPSFLAFLMTIAMFAVSLVIGCGLSEEEADCLSGARASTGKTMKAQGLDYKAKENKDFRESLIKERFDNCMNNLKSE